MAQKILIIEDQHFLSDLLEREFEREGFDVVSSDTCAGGLEKIKVFKPDLLLLDMQLPDGDGFSVLEKKNADSEISGIPTIIISSSGQPVEVERALQYGVKDYLIKAQFEPREVLSKVKQELMNSATGKEVQMGVASTSGTIVLIEDDMMLSELLKKKLTDSGYTVHHAIEGSEGLELIRNEIPDVVVCDLLLPGTDGFEILRSIKTDVRIKKIPVLLLSNLGHENDLARGKELGAANFLIKASVTLDEIIVEIQHLMEKAKGLPG